MRIALLAKRQSIHTIQWVEALAEHGHEVHLISSVHEGEELHKNARFHPLPVPPPVGFFLNVLALRRLLRQIRPEILNTHFASGYGALARLSGFHPNVLSVWGSDVYDFPNKSPLHAWLIRENLRGADWVCSTSREMAKQAQGLLPVPNLSVVPFGVDTERFRPGGRREDDRFITIGTVKTLSSIYGIDVLLRAFAELRRRAAAEGTGVADRLRLLIVGGGPEEMPLKRLSRDLGIDDVTSFVGQVPHHDVPAFLQQLDVYVALSRRESFGVAVLEASACALPVVVSNVGGLPEVVEDGRTGIVVPSEDASAAAGALFTLVVDERLRSAMGSMGRMHVERHFTWERASELMLSTYRKALVYER